MKIKTKLNLGVGLLFLMILILAVSGVWYVNRLKSDTNNILASNYNTLRYTKDMLTVLDAPAGNGGAIDEFRANMEKQRENITEPGERRLTELLFQHFLEWRANPEDNALLSLLRRDLLGIMDFNMEAIKRKSSVAEATSQHAIIMISVVGTLCFTLAFTLLVNLPSSIADPIRELSESIRQIAKANYTRRIHYDKHNEFGELARSFNTMAEKLEEYSESSLEKILKSKKRIEALIDSMHDPVIGLDEERKILFVNEEASSVIGLRKRELVAKPVDGVASTNELLRRILESEERPSTAKAKTPLLKIYADNKESFFEKEVIDINIVPTGETDAQFIGQVILLKNVTPFKELDLAKTRFMGTVSHEFKTPIASIQMGVQLLENEQVGNLNDEQRDLVLGIREDSGRLLRITTELLNITQVESGSIQISVLPAAISPIIDYAINANKAAAEQKQVSIRVEKQPGLEKVMADNEKTAWVLTNLLSNAIRYSYEHAEILLKIQEEGEMVRFSVSDTGQGIEAQYLTKIFERYFRIPGTKKEGTGLGLSISKEFIEAQGGRISVESEYGAGSTFSFALMS